MNRVIFLWIYLSAIALGFLILVLSHSSKLISEVRLTKSIEEELKRIKLVIEQKRMNRGRRECRSDFGIEDFIDETESGGLRTLRYDILISKEPIERPVRLISFADLLDAPVAIRDFKTLWELYEEGEEGTLEHQFSGIEGAFN